MEWDAARAEAYAIAERDAVVAFSPGMSGEVAARARAGIKLIPSVDVSASESLAPDVTREGVLPRFESLGLGGKADGECRHTLSLDSTTATCCMSSKNAPSPEGESRERGRS